MKRIFKLTILFLFLFVGVAGAVGTCTETNLGRATSVIGNITIQSGMYVIKVACTADAAAATIPDEAITDAGGNLIAVFMDWGATAPTSGAYDIYIKADSMSDADLLGGAGVNLATTSDIWITPLVGDVYVPSGFVGNLTVSQAGNAVNSATPTAYLVFVP